MRTRHFAFFFGAPALTLALALAACGDDDSPVSASDAGEDGDSAAQSDTSVNPQDGTTPPKDAGVAVDAFVADTGAADSGDAGIDRGPAKIMIPNLPLAATPNGLFYQQGSDAALYISDQNNNAILRWDDHKGFVSQVTLPDILASDAGGTGQLVRLEDGTFFVTRFGFGIGGGIIYVAATGDAGMIPGLDVTRKRIGLTLLPDGTLATGYFTGSGATAVGAVAKLTAFTGNEKDFITNLVKPVGVQYNENKILVSDQTQGYVVQSTSLTTGGQFQSPMDGGPDAGGSDAGDGGGLPNAFAILAGADLLCQGPDGSIFAATKVGTVYQIARDGSAKQIVTGTLVGTGGVAYDGANQRLFVAEVDATNGSSIHIYPIN